MKEIKAYVRENMRDAVMDALAAIPGLPGIAVVHLREYGHAADDGLFRHEPAVDLPSLAPSEAVAEDYAATGLSLSVILGVLAITTIASLVKSKRDGQKALVDEDSTPTSE